MPEGPFVSAEQELAHLRALHRITVALHRGASPADLYDEAVDAVVSVVGVDRASLLLFDPDGVMRFKAWRGLSDDYRQAVEGHTPWGPGDAGAAPITIPDVAADRELASLLPVFRAEGIGAIAFVPLLRPGGVMGKFMLYYDAPHVFSAQEVATAEILAAHVALSLERRAAEEALRVARAEAETAAARLATLARVTAELSQAASVAEVAGVVLGTAVEELGGHTGSLCLLRGQQLEIAYAQGYPGDVLETWGAFPLDAELPASEAVRWNRAVYIRSPEERDARYPVFARTPVIGNEAFAIFPLGEDKPFGCLVIGFAEAHALDETDESFLSELSARCSAALVRARLYDEREQLFEERTLIARTLQASLLPPELPEIAGVELAARYVAAGSGVDVGGDFYDVFRLDARRFVVVLGDVCGRGVGAASLAALCRHTVRSAAVATTDPAAILAHVNEVLLRHAPDAYEPRFCTAVVGVGSLGDDGVVLDLALGGHPPPMVRRAGGAVERVGAPGFLLGVRAAATATVTRVALGPGDALVCVTDGVLERRRPGAIFGDHGLAMALAAAPGQADALAASLESAVLSFSEEAGDDLAVLVVEAGHPASAQREPSLAAAAGETARI